MDTLFPLFAPHGIPGIGLLILFCLSLKMASKVPESARAQVHHFRLLKLIVLSVCAISLLSLYWGASGRV
ncbi:hypothetical protein [Vagococcus sp. WN89Y]|uniref:hypothetical protein n=1 Tax=Vagococcus sp. WN89Y TaxID=3457258 RepID=UPI003FCE7139